MKWTEIDTKPNGYKSELELMKSQTPHQRLGIETTATLLEAKKAYKDKVRLYHPDRTDGFMSQYSSEVVKLLNDAIKRIKKAHGKKS
ncbi:J domain-containing protein [Vibrio lentus]|uniref:J domain-containing protein n=1 Tax=Vibrio lentus TaxID=136468 RepID=A0AA45A8T6_9VIBR|nr:J domain-containing protein [Vibrio lentus]MCB5358364.1 J domain-containing protein [Vibrio lentus]MCB5448833.1 J domain-containing protein [Vibrio lentus]MCB5460720.1 J domain-containing protein [Vibrio lentus]MCC4796127.1 J domain-containing protein [Vibrio lentus]MCC4854005.1 J domain-containing protein [Vibrio lentus]